MWFVAISPYFHYKELTAPIRVFLFGTKPNACSIFASYSLKVNFLHGDPIIDNMVWLSVILEQLSVALWRHNSCFFVHHFSLLPGSPLWELSPGDHSLDPWFWAMGLMHLYNNSHVVFATLSHLGLSSVFKLWRDRCHTVDTIYKLTVLAINPNLECWVWCKSS